MTSLFITRAKQLYTELFVTYHPVIADKNVTKSSTIEVIQEQTPRYPPIDQGIPLYSIESLIITQQNLIDRIRKTSGVTPDDFQSYFSPIITNLAHYIHLLPATKTGNHRVAGGLFRLSLELGFHSLQVANSSIFQNKGSATSEERIKIQPRWVYATFISAVCEELYRPIT
ncbi:MAG: TraI domain-containing protein, partial [Methylococcaceae bacterium]